MNLKRGIELYCSSVVVYGLALMLILPLYQKILRHETVVILLIFYAAYILLSPIFYFFLSSQESTNKPWIILQSVLNRQFGSAEKTAVLFLGVKLFFLPLMLNFFMNNLNSLNRPGLEWYPLLVTLLFTIDTFIFTLGYAFEGKMLGNAVRSVEPTFFGWFVCLICYPPFNSIVGERIPWGANDYVLFWNDSWTVAFRLLLLFLLTLYVWATIALGMKSSNLTNRGIVSRFPYSVVRHPAYVTKTLFWWITLIPVMSVAFFFGMLFWTLIYFFRAMTEERHLMADADYKAYCEKVQWRFIPGIV